MGDGEGRAAKARRVAADGAARLPNRPDGLAIPLSGSGPGVQPAAPPTAQRKATHIMRPTARSRVLAPYFMLGALAAFDVAIPALGVFGHVLLGVVLLMLWVMGMWLRWRSERRRA